MVHQECRQKCKGCGKFFAFFRGLNDNKKHCNQACVQRAYRARRKANQFPRRTRDRSYAFFIGPCQHCGADVWGNNSRQKYCTGKCRTAACRARRLETPMIYDEMRLAA